MSKAQKISLWIICCVGLGLGTALMDGIGTVAVLQAAVIIAILVVLGFAAVMVWTRFSS